VSRRLYLRKRGRVKVGKGIFSVSGWKRNVVTVYVCMYVRMCWLSRQRVGLEEGEEDVGVWMELIIIIIEGALTLIPEPMRNAGYD